MVYDREGRKLWIVEDTGKHKPVGSWEEITKRPRRPDLPDWWLIAKDIDWRPSVLTRLANDAGDSGTSLLSMHLDGLERALAAVPDSSGSGAGGTGTKLGCGGACQETYDTSTGKYTGGGSSGGGQTRTKSTPPKTSTPARTERASTRSYKAAGADRTPPPPKWPDSNPPTPPGVDLEKNMREAEAHQDDPYLAKRQWFVQQVDSEQPWDYKHTFPANQYERIEDFGNFNFGATGAALGISEEELQRAAGAKQMKDHILDPSQYTTPLVYPYGDDPRDAAMIRRGIEHYKKWKANQKH